ncbi:MAG TPA: type II toxin-antitoxin system Phd/YefM family antitoxin [Dehalococcoidia bacterium]|nr:type II toxin-antitoxin system Phd/YefM family antitoxin [Dehalococcoidia bacterium]
MIVNIHDAKTHFSRLVERVSSGEEVVIGKAGKPVAKLVPYTTPTEKRVPGAWRGRVRIAADFDDLPAEMAAAFRGERP